MQNARSSSGGSGTLLFLLNFFHSEIHYSFRHLGNKILNSSKEAATDGRLTLLIDTTKKIEHTDSRVFTGSHQIRELSLWLVEAERFVIFVHDLKVTKNGTAKKHGEVLFPNLLLESPCDVHGEVGHHFVL